MNGKYPFWLPLYNLSTSTTSWPRKFSSILCDCQYQTHRHGNQRASEGGRLRGGGGKRVIFNISPHSLSSILASHRLLLPKLNSCHLTLACFSNCYRWLSIYFLAHLKICKGKLAERHNCVHCSNNIFGGKLHLPLFHSKKKKTPWVCTFMFRPQKMFASKHLSKFRFAQEYGEYFEVFSYPKVELPIHTAFFWK